MDSWYMKWAAMVVCGIAGISAYELIGWATLSATEWASWVQAVGSIAAIIGAYYVGER